MKKSTINLITLFALLIFLLTNFNCKKKNIDEYCQTTRANYLSITDKDAMVVYSNKYARYAVSFTLTNPNNIDHQIIGFICNLNSELKSIGLHVTVSGTLKNFNSNENISPEIAGQDLYFFEPTQIIKTP